MTQILTRQNCPQPNPPPDRLFVGGMICWGSLTTAEKIICANIVLLPVWWLVGIMNYLLLFSALAIACYEWRRYGKLNLKSPSWAVIALFAFYAYDLLDTLFVYLDVYWSIEIPPDTKVTLNQVIKAILPFSIPFLIWYIQSNRIKVRLEVIAWAGSVSAIQMFLGWVLFQFAFPEWIESPPRNLYAVLTGKGSFNPEDVSGWTNYLAYYDEDRVRFFFGHYQAAAAFLGFIGLVAVELKHRLWGYCLLASCGFLLILIGSRSIWLALPTVLAIRFAIALVQWRLTALMFAMLAIFSFSTLSFTPVTEFIFSAFDDTATAVANARAGSTEGRSKVYRATLEKIPEKPFFGHKVLGPPAIGGPSEYVFNPPRIGSHSYILGDLIYKKGAVGLILFAAFWASLIAWFYETRRERPPCWFPILALFTLQSALTVLQFTMILGTLLCMILDRPSHRRPLSQARRNSWRS